LLEGFEIDVGESVKIPTSAPRKSWIEKSATPIFVQKFGQEKLD